MKKFKSIVWTEFDRQDRMVTKSRQFKTTKALEAFVKKLELKGNFNEIIAWGY